MLSGLIPAILLLVGVIRLWMMNNLQDDPEDDGSPLSRILRRNIPETEVVVYYAQSGSGQLDNEYHFKYRKLQDGWRAYILRMPNLRGRNGGGAITHRLYDHGRAYICWDRSVETLKDIKTISRVWADHIQEYIETGKRFG